MSPDERLEIEDKTLTKEQEAEAMLRRYRGLDRSQKKGSALRGKLHEHWSEGRLDTFPLSSDEHKSFGKDSRKK